MRVLIAEDDPISRRVLESFLVKWGYEVIVALDGQEAWNLLQDENAPTMAILDWMMPGLDGVEVCQRVRTRTSQPYMYLLLLTAKGSKQDIVEALEAGADDYLTKPFDAAELKARLRAGIRVLDLQQQLISARESLRIQATHDPLTGLSNRGEIFAVFERELERARREKTSLGVVMTDIDHFKRINDTYGHFAGDAVLREVASRLLHAVRPYDSVGRYGGEEFLIIVPGCDLDLAVKQAERLRDSVATEPVALDNRVSIPVTLSLGVAATPDLTGDSHDLVQVADAALYRAKKNGRNRTEWGGPATTEKEDASDRREQHEG
jgi:two-component system, cell cycle response regulator